MKQNKSIFLIPVMLCFFCMGFVDLVGIASNYVKADLGLSDSVANVFPSLVFFWFLIFSVPTGMLMNKIGRKNTVLLSLVVTVVSLLIPLFGNSFAVMLVAFSLGGVGVHVGVLTRHVGLFGGDDLEEHLACLGFAGDVTLVTVSDVTFCHFLARRLHQLQFHLVLDLVHGHLLLAGNGNLVYDALDEVFVHAFFRHKHCFADRGLDLFFVEADNSTVTFYNSLNHGSKNDCLLSASFEALCVNYFVNILIIRAKKEVP